MSELVRSWALALALAGCAPALKDLAARDANLAVPAAFPTDSTAPSAATVAWATWFDDPALVGLVDTAVQNNQELGIALQETRIANAEFLARRGEYVPRLGVGAEVGLERVGKFTSQGASDAADDIEPGRKVPEDLGDFAVGFEASWEVDLWKRLRNLSQAARLRALGSVEVRNYAVTGVVAEVAATYYELLALDNQLRVLDTNIQLLTDSLEVVKLQKDAARVTELAVQRFEADLEKSRARRAEVVAQIAVTENRLNALCGRYPQAVPRDPAAFDRATVGAQGLGTPQDLLQNRPDIRAAELGLEAAKLDVKAARAAFYPALGLDAAVGLDAFSVARLPSPESLAYGVAGGLFAPLLNRAELKGEYLAANARQTQAALVYERSLVGACAEVAGQQGRLDNLSQSYESKSRQVEKLQAAVETSTGLFANARADWLEVLTTRREALEAQMELIETRQRQLDAKVALYRALGGGWREGAAP